MVMATEIKKIIDNTFQEIDVDDCIDITQIKSMCNLYQNKNSENIVISIGDIIFNSPEYTKNFCKNINKKNILESNEFIRTYTFFLKIIYACLKIEVEIFDIGNDIVTLKNNYQLMKALKNKKKELICEHINILKNQIKKFHYELSDDYILFNSQFISKIKVIDKISYYIDKIIKSEKSYKTSNLLSLLLPYFYKYAEFIEEYN